MGSIRFKEVKLLDHGVSNPIVRRISRQFFDILDSGFTTIPAADIERIKTLLFDLMRKLLYAYDDIAKFAKIEIEAKEAIDRDGVRTRGAGISFDDPTFALKKVFEDAITRLVVAHRQLSRIASLILDKEIKGGNQLMKQLFAELPLDKSARMWLEKDNEWLTSLYEVRGQIEHEELVISQFDVEVNDNGSISNIIPTKLTIDGNLLSLKEYLEVTLVNMVGFCEDSLALLLRKKMQPVVKIAMIPDDLRAQFQGYKWKLESAIPLPKDAHEKS